jgi:hypothetical protein
MRALSIRILLAVFASVTLARATNYPIRHLDPTDALMALTVRVPDISGDCRITPVQAKDPGSAGVRGFLEIQCSTKGNFAKIQAALEAIDAPPPTHRFHVAVLAASRNEGPMPDLSAGEQKALSDFKKVMTYKSFKTEAEAILQCDRESQSRISGGYLLELSINPYTGGGESIDVNSFRLRGATLQAAPGGGGTNYENLIATSFSITRGETVVLGTTTSDQSARVVLVTALP